MGGEVVVVVAWIGCFEVALAAIVADIAKGLQQQLLVSIIVGN